jgi:glutaryl-CoA dehydrogenase
VTPPMDPLSALADLTAMQLYTFEGTETMQTLIVGRDITGISAFTH